MKKKVWLWLLLVLLLAFPALAEENGHTHELVNQAPVAATCTEHGLTTGTYCNTCGEVIVPQEKLSAIGHDYSAGPVFQWNDGGDACYLVFTCGHDENHTKVVEGNVTSEVTTPPTRSAMGQTTYTVVAVEDGVTYTDTLVLQDIPMEEEIPNTGDTSAPALWLMLMIFSAASLAVMGAKKKVNK